MHTCHSSCTIPPPTRTASRTPNFRALRDEEPVSHHDHPGWERGYWVVTRHSDVQRVSRDWTAFRNAPIRSCPTPPTSTTAVRHCC